MAKMTNSVKMLVPALGLTLVLSAYAQGTSGGTTGQPGQPAGQQHTQQAVVVTTQPTQSAVGQQQAQPRRDARLSQVIGMNVRDPAG
jgi:hypothetical protein